MAAPSINQIVRTMENLNYQVFTKSHKPYNLNIVGLRTADKTVNVFNDWEYNFWWDPARKRFDGFVMKITTDPGLYWMLHYDNPKGVAILKHGQWKDMWTLDFHQGKYEALCQRPEKNTLPVTVIRDYDRDNYLDFDSGVEDSGFFWINNHRANEQQESVIVDKWSAGCQVVASPTAYKKHIGLCKESVKYWGNLFTYTLLLERQLVA